MGHIVKTPAGTFRANWRDDAGRQKAKTFNTRRDAAAFLAETEATINRGTYVDPHAGRIRLGEYAQRWLAARVGERTTIARDRSIMHNHVLPRWGDTPLLKIDHLAVQQWVTDLSGRLSPATVAECFRLLSGVIRTAIRDRRIAFNPCEGVRLPRRRKKDTDGQTVTYQELTRRLLPAVPDRYRALVALAGGTGLRWGECNGLRWSAVHWGRWNHGCDAHDEAYCLKCFDKYEVTVSVIRTVVEVAGTVTVKQYPKSRRGRRVVPVPAFAAELLAAHHDAFPAGPVGEVFTNQASGPVRRTLFRARVWRPALVRAGLLGRVEEVRPFKYRAAWTDVTGLEWSAEFTTEREAVAHVATKQAGGLRFHDLRHSYSTWLADANVPPPSLARIVGHERPSTTLDLYADHVREAQERVRRVFADDLMTSITDDNPK